MPRVVVNSTPLILLSGIGRLDLLARLYGTIVIPSAVYGEVTAKEDSASCALRSLPSWLSIEQAPDLPKNYRRLISAKLHASELEVMSLALTIVWSRLR